MSRQSDGLTTTTVPQRDWTIFCVSANYGFPLLRCAMFCIVLVYSLSYINIAKASALSNGQTSEIPYVQHIGNQYWPDGGLRIDFVGTPTTGLNRIIGNKTLSITDANNNDVPFEIAPTVLAKQSTLTIVVLPTPNPQIEQLIYAKISDILHSAHTFSTLHIYRLDKQLQLVAGNLETSVQRKEFLRLFNAGSRNQHYAGTVETPQPLQKSTEHIATSSVNTYQKALAWWLKRSNFEPRIHAYQLNAGIFIGETEVLNKLPDDILTNPFTSTIAVEKKPDLLTTAPVQLLHPNANTLHHLYDKLDNAKVFALAICQGNLQFPLQVSLANKKFTISKEQELGLLRWQRCDTKQILNHQRDYPDTLNFDLDSWQVLAYRTYKRSLEKTEFAVNLRTDGKLPLTRAKVRLRGQSSLHCERKSFALTLPPDYIWHMLPGASGGEYYLLSMCGDDTYIQNRALFDLWHSAGLFPLKYGYVELKIGGESEGIYLLVERPVQGILASTQGVEDILRRGFKRGATSVEANYSTHHEINAANDFYVAMMLIQRESGAQFAATLEKHIDVDQYLTHLAIASILQNSDYVDEVFFYNQQSYGTDKPGRYRLMSWDAEDLFLSCHYNGRYEKRDPWGLSYCIESEIGQSIIAEPELFARYVAKLEEVMSSTLSREKYKAALEVSRKQISKFIYRPNILNNMVRFRDEDSPKSWRESITLDEVEVALKIRFDDMLAYFDNRQIELHLALAKYKRDMEKQLIGKNTAG